MNYITLHNKTESLHNMQKQARSTTVLEEILLDLHHHTASWISMANPTIFIVKKYSGPTLKIQ